MAYLSPHPCRWAIAESPGSASGAHVGVPGLLQFNLMLGASTSFPSASVEFHIMLFGGVTTLRKSATALTPF